MNIVPAYEVRTGDRVAITLKNGSRIAGTVTSQKTDRGGNWVWGIRSITGGFTRLDITDTATIAKI